MEESLNKMEQNAFKEMKETQKELEKLKEFKFDDELNETKAKHQRVMMEVQQEYGRFLFLLKLIVSVRLRRLAIKMPHLKWYSL